jgi:ATP-dependent DNA helicase DinG
MYEQVKDMVRYPCRVQEAGASTGSLETWFKEEKRPVLFATKSFWEGVSIEGKQLRMVVIPKVPFPSPVDPIMDEKKRIISERFGNKAWFMKLYFPNMVMDVLQGLGRLMRRQDDFGVAAILDTRVIPGAPGAKYYGRQLVQSLPFTNATHDIDRIRLVMENMEKGMGPF